MPSVLGETSRSRARGYGKASVLLAIEQVIGAWQTTGAISTWCTLLSCSQTDKVECGSSLLRFDLPSPIKPSADVVPFVPD